MKIELLVNGKTYPMITKSFNVLKAGQWVDVIAPTLTREESIRLDADVGELLGFYDLFSDAVTYCYLEGEMTSGSFGDDDNYVVYSILVDGKSPRTKIEFNSALADVLA
jgi:hypothetical protein